MIARYVSKDLIVSHLKIKASKGQKEAVYLLNIMIGQGLLENRNTVDGLLEDLVQFYLHFEENKTENELEAVQCQEHWSEKLLIIEGLALMTKSINDLDVKR